MSPSMVGNFIIQAGFFVETVAEYVRQIGSALELFVTPLLHKMPVVAAFDKGREKYARKTVLGIHHKVLEDSSSSSDESDEDRHEHKKKRTVDANIQESTTTTVNVQPPATTTAVNNTSSTKSTRHQRRKRSMQGFAPYNNAPRVDGNTTGNAVASGRHVAAGNAASGNAADGNVTALVICLQRANAILKDVLLVKMRLHLMMEMQLEESW